METILLCIHSLEGIFSAIYVAYRDHMLHERTHIVTDFEQEQEMQQELFCEYRKVEANEEYFIKVRRTLIQKLGWDVYEKLCEALAVEKKGMADAVYHTVVKGLRGGPNTGVSVLNDLTDPYIHKVFFASQSAWGEIHHLMGFLRFEERGGEEKILYSRIGPEHNIVTFLAPHFADRLPGENFMIHDVKRGLFVIHPKQSPWYVRLEKDGNQLQLPPLTKEEQVYRECFKALCKSITIESRRNMLLQRQMLPLRFREFMVEFE